MSSDGEHFVFDINGQNPNQRSDRHSPPALDEASVPQSPRRPPHLFLPRQGSVDYSRYEQILRKTKKYDTITDLPYHLREEVQDCLNIEKESRTDWRGVASRMKVKPSTIEKIEKEYKDPTKKVFQEISSQKITELLQVLYQMDRHDVLNIFFDELCIKTDENKSVPPGANERREKYGSSKFPSQESTPVSGASEPSSASDFHLTPNTPKSPFKDTGTPESAERSDSGMGSTGTCTHHPRKKTGSFAKQNTDEDLARRSKSTVNFHSSESEQFWRKIPPKAASTRKEWKEVEAALKKDFKKQCMQSSVMRMICYVLKIEPYGKIIDRAVHWVRDLLEANKGLMTPKFTERHNKFVHDRDFANLVAWFGPIKTGKDGLFSKIDDLIKTSVTYKENTGPHSYFAGYMSKEEADTVISGAEQVGTFLIRFSSTYAEDGSFVVVLKTNNGPEHHLLEGNAATGKIKFQDKEYEDLPTLYRRGLCKGGVSNDRRISCIYTCPNLPLNAMFKPYGAGPRPLQSLGRGRGRGRGQEQ